ncbi:MAG: hypothetical protein FJX72_15830 [Armatimonadetes bacterium]|nr:hypothetical protein [Armatimonadota bacterium]
MVSQLTVADLEAGTKAFLGKPGWESDLHANLYRELSDALAGGLDREWWDRTVPRLSSWLALRPHSKDTIRAQGLNQLPALAEGYRTVIQRAGAERFDLTGVCWSDIADLFAAAHEIKSAVHRRKYGHELHSAVFPGKLCHFIMPHVFVVVDGEMMGGCTDYQTFWIHARDLWRRAEPIHAQLKGALARHTGAAGPEYPWPTKIVELCLMGARHR